MVAGWLQGGLYVPMMDSLTHDLPDHVSTLHPWTSPLNNTRTHSVPKPAVTVRRPNITNDIFDGPSTYVKFYSIVSPSNADLSKLNMFAVDGEICKIIGEPSRISPNQDKSLTVKVKTDAQGQKLLTMKTLVKETVTVQPHVRFKVSQGVITSSYLKDYSEEQIVEGLTDQGVSKAYRIKQKTDQGNLIPTNTLIITFNSSVPPEKVCIWAGYFERVRQLNIYLFLDDVSGVRDMATLPKTVEALKLTVAYVPRSEQLIALLRHVTVPFMASIVKNRTQHPLRNAQDI